LEKRTRQTFLKAEFGFAGVIVRTERTTPRLKGATCSEKRLSRELNHFLRDAVLDFF
jgi:hypothetical protein